MPRQPPCLRVRVLLELVLTISLVFSRLTVKSCQINCAALMTRSTHTKRHGESSASLRQCQNSDASVVKDRGKGRAVIDRLPSRHNQKASPESPHLLSNDGHLWLQITSDSESGQARDQAPIGPSGDVCSNPAESW
jgi:hypothetical protein